MAMAVVTVTKNGIPVVDNTAGASTKKTGMRVSEATNGFGIPVVKVASNGMEVVYVPPNKF